MQPNCRICVRDAKGKCDGKRVIDFNKFSFFINFNFNRMKKKIFSKLLMGAFLLASISSFVSCKDYDDDINANRADIRAAQEQLATLTSNLSALQTKLETEKTALQQELATAKSQFETQIANAKAELNAAIAAKADQATVDGLAKRVADLESNLAATKEAFQAKIDAINTSLATLQGLIAQKADQTYVDQAIATLQNAIDGKISKEDFNTLKNDFAILKTNLENLATLVDTKASSADLTNAVNLINQSIELLKNDIKTKIDETAFNALSGKVDGISDAVNNLKTAVDDKADKTALTALEEALTKKINALAEQIGNFVTPEQLQKAIDDLTALIATKCDHADFDKLNAQVQNIQGVLDTRDENITKQLTDAINDLRNELMPLINSKVDQEEYNGTIADITADLEEAQDSIVSIIATLVVVDGHLDTIDEALELLNDTTKALRNSINENVVAIRELDVQAKAVAAFLQGYLTGEGATNLQAVLANLASAMSKELKDSINKQNQYRVAAIAEIGKQITNLKAELQKQLQDSLTNHRNRIAELEKKFNNLGTYIDDRVNANLNSMKVFIDRLLKSLVLRPDTYYGGIEGISVYTYVLPKEQNENHNGKKYYHYFDRIGTVNISDYGEAQYHLNPSNADLENYTIDFYNWIAQVKEPACEEQPVTRSGQTGITPVYKTTKELLAANKDNVKDGIITVPFTADAATIEARLENGQATIASLAMTKKSTKAGVADTTVNSDYAMVVPEYGYGLLIGDKTFPVTTRHLDQIGYDGGAVNSSNLHRSFSFLALATTSPTHEIKYDKSFDITAVLQSRYVPNKDDYDREITDTAVYVSHSNHKAIARWNQETLNIEEDGDASIDKNKVVTMTPALFEKLGFKYDIQLVDYTLGSNKTGETVHLELITDPATGHVIAYPRNVTAAGETIKGVTANAACVGRQPIVCIMVRDKNDNIVSFAYMKFLITQYEEQAPEEKEVGFEIKDIWVNCKGFDGRVTWSEVEFHILDQLLNGMSKEDFDKNYVFDYYQETTEQIDQEGATYNRVSRYGIQYEGKGGKRLNQATEFGEVVEEWNLSAQGTEDATTHILKWSFTAEQLAAKAEALKAAGKLEDKGDYYANKEPITTWVRYAHLNYTMNDAPAVGSKPTKGNPSIWVKLTIPAGEFHVAKGDMGANKILTYWYALNSKTNATGTSDAFEVRINVPVPVPETAATEKTIGYDYPANANKLNIRYDNLLEEANQEYIDSKRTDFLFSEFTKNLKDFFIDGKLTATVKMSSKFSSIKGMKLGVEFITPSTAIGNATFNAAADGTWTVKGYSGTTYTLKLNADHTKVQIVKRGNAGINPIDLITLNYDDNATADNRQITVLNYVNGPDQDDILNYKTHNELAERETFTVYLNIKAIDACAPVFWDNMWFNARFLRPLDLEEPKQALVPDAPNDWHEVDLTDALIVKDWREYYGDRTNSTLGADVKKNIPGVGNVKAFDFAYYQVEVEIEDGAYITDANLGTSQRSDNYTLGQMPAYNYTTGLIKTSQVPNLKFEKIAPTKLRYLNNSGVTGGFHVFVPVQMTYVYGHMQVKQKKYVTVGVTASVEQAMIEGE